MTRSRLSLRSWVLLAVPALALAGCSSGVGGFLEAPACMPPPYALSPDRVEAGGTVRIAAEDADCDPSYGDAAQVEVLITTSEGVRILRALSPMADAGGFSTDVVVPVDALPGDYLVAAYPYGVDWCDDTGVNNRLSREAGDDGFVRASCAAVGLPLVVVP